MIPDQTQNRTEVLILYRVISRRDHDRMQDWLQACPGSYAERVYAGTFAVFIPVGGAVEAS